MHGFGEDLRRVLQGFGEGFPRAWENFERILRSFLKSSGNDQNVIRDIDNPLYKKWITDQEKNIFEGPCNACDMYEPIYAKQLHLVLKGLLRPFSG